MEKYQPFPCDCCGECCKHVNLIPLYNCLDDGTGRCRFLNKDNRCSIYAFRPNLCRGEYVYKTYYPHLSVKEFHSISLELCRKLKGEI